MTATMTYAPARFEAAPEFSETLGDECVAFAEAAGLVLDEWQRDVIRAALGTDPVGRWAAMEVALIVPRQNGKGSVLEALELYHLFMVPTTRLITHTAHRFDTCLDHFRRIRSLIENTPQLLALVKDNGRGIGGAPSGIKDSNGKESIELVDGCRLIFKTRDKGSGAGFSGDLVVIDEAWYIRDLSGLIPTMAARENPQVWYTSSAPHPRVESDNLRSLIRQGRALAENPDYQRPDPDDPTMAYFEWSVDQERAAADPEGEDVIRDGNPAYGIRINRRFCRMERKRMGDAMYLRERHGVFPDTDEAPQWEIISEAAWKASEDTDGLEAGWLEAPVSLGVEMPTERGAVSIAAAGNCRGGGDGVNLVAVVPSDEALDLLVALTSDDAHPVRHVVIDPSSPAATLIPDLEAEGVTVLRCKYVDLKVATGDFYDDLNAGTIHHRAQPELIEAVSRAKKRTSGDTWLINRRAPHDPSPFGACVVARWGHRQPVAAPTRSGVVC